MLFGKVCMVFEKASMPMEISKLGYYDKRQGF